MKQILDLLLKEKDNKQAEFIHKLTPTLDRGYFLGVKVPKIRNIAKSISLEDAKAFFSETPHKYYEENMLHGFLLSKIKDFDELMAEIDRFLPFVDNWATCDTMAPKMLKKHTDKLISYINKWIKSKHTYTVRFAIVCLMNFYDEDEFKSDFIEMVNSVKSEEYYVKIAVAWYNSVILVKHYNKIIKLFESKTLEKWIQNKSIQKAIESCRISDETKVYLKTLKV